MKKFLLFFRLSLFIIFIAVIYLQIRLDHKELSALKKRLISKDLLIRGKISGIKRSGNHGFGIYLISVYFRKGGGSETGRIAVNKHAPFRIVNGIGEVYATIGLNDFTGYLIEVDGSTEMITIRDRNNHFVSETCLTPLREYQYMKFVEDNTIFKTVDKPDGH